MSAKVREKDFQKEQSECDFFWSEVGALTT